MAIYSKVFHAAIRTQHFLPEWKHAHVICILKPWEDPALLSSYRPLSLHDTIGRLFEKILLTRFLSEINGHKLLRDGHFWFTPKHITSLKLALLIGRVTRIWREESNRPGFRRCC